MLTVKIEALPGNSFKSKISLLDEFKNVLDHWVMPTVIAKNMAGGHRHDWYSRRIEAARQKHEANLRKLPTLATH